MKTQKLFPAYKDYVWGGKRLVEEFGKTFEGDRLAESWELSFHPDGLTRLANGNTLSESVTKAELGKNLDRFSVFPTLIKFIDAKANLSIQVHPSDDYALNNENSLGKTEMWYIVDADDGAGIYLGFNAALTKEQLTAAIENSTFTDILNFYPVKKGECYFIPSGTVHAICKGCLILEIQQNSNLTYRVYDYDRVDANGNKRQLHVEKAMKVTSLDKFAPRKFSGMLGASKYFTVKKYAVTEKRTFQDQNSFNCVTCVEGNGTIDGEPILKGDSFFVPCGAQYTVCGNAQLVITSVRRYFVGIDLGGTNIKGGVVDDLGNIVAFDSVPTMRTQGDKAVAGRIAELVKSLVKRSGLTNEDIEGVGIGVPGLVDTQSGVVEYSNNLKWKNFDITKTVAQLSGLPVKIANDADVAALGEWLCGAGKGYCDLIMLTLGTGVGGGAVFCGKPYTGNRGAGIEVGHTVLVSGGRPCTCGRKGCAEAYCSATALKKMTVAAMEKNPDSLMWQVGSIKNVSGRTAFDYSDRDESAKSVVNEYIHWLSELTVNVVNAYRPEVVVIGGGVCGEKGRLTRPLNAAIKKYGFGKKLAPKCKVVTAKLGNRAGLVGAAALWL